MRINRVRKRKYKGMNKKIKRKIKRQKNESNLKNSELDNETPLTTKINPKFED